jgi:cytochrome c peroxidase
VARRLLFWDPVLSGNRDVACATCHHPDFAYSDGRDLSLGTNAVGLGPARRSADARRISPFDRYMRGESGAMTEEQVRGMERFESAGCANCHSGAMFSDFAPHVLRVPDNPVLAESDAGTGAYAFARHRCVTPVSPPLTCTTECSARSTRCSPSTAASTVGAAGEGEAD